MRIWINLVLVVALLMALGPPPVRADEIPADEVSGVTVTPLLSTTKTAGDQLIEVPAHPEVVVSRYAIAPGIALPLHRHPYPRYAYVLSGTLEVTIQGGKTHRYKAGDFIIEVVNQWHTGKNVGDTPVQLLVIDQVVPGRSNVITAPR
jgi:quercetin dioxygenase-like cupin family protein